MRDVGMSPVGPGGQQNNISHGGGSIYATQHGDVNVSGPPAQPPPAGERIRILMLAANPLDSARLAIDEEARQIAQRLRLSDGRDLFDLITCLAVRPMDLQQYLNQYRPHIVHFSGHGDSTGEVLLADDDGTGRRVSATALAGLFRVANDNIRVVVLNACYSAAAVRVIGRHVDYIVGMQRPITDEAATVFAASFYSALGFRRTVPEAFAQAVAMLPAYGHDARELAQLVARPEADPRLLVGSR
jgi:hypothetical protein